MKITELKKIIKQEITKLNEAETEPLVSIEDACKAFDKKTKNEFKLSGYKWNGKQAKLDPKDFGLFGKRLSNIYLYIWSKGITKEDNYSYYNIYLMYDVKGGGSNGIGIGTVFIHNEDKSVSVRLDDGRFLK